MLVGDELRKHRVSVQAAPNEQLPRVKGDRIQVQQVLLNLITNAIDSMAAKDGPRVLRVGFEVHDGGGVIVSVADTGTGIGSQELEQIFNPLFTTKSGGMGMGLSICRSIIEPMPDDSRLVRTSDADQKNLDRIDILRRLMVRSMLYRILATCIAARGVG